MNVDFDLIRSQTFLSTIEVHDEIESTNDRALQLSSDASIDLPTLVITNSQSRGRGRCGNQWWFGEGALAFSLLIDRPPAELLPRMSLTTGLAICESLSAVWPPGNFGLKWPNDVYLNGKKICGILIEQPTTDERIVIGIGVNANNSLQKAPSEIKDIGTSLIDHVGSAVNLTTTLCQILNSLEDHLQVLESPNLPSLWRKRCILSDRTITVTVGSQSDTGLCTGIANDGTLTLETSSGRKSIVAGSVTIL